MADIMSDTRDATIERKNVAARAAWAAGDMAGAETLLLEAWAELDAAELEGDAAKTDWHQKLSSSLVTLYQRTQQFDEARRWLETMRRLYEKDGAPDPHILFVRATLDYDSSDFDAAFDGFATLYAKFGKRPFAGKDVKYLQFYESRR